MLLNRHSLDAAKFASKSESSPVLSALCVTETHVVATDAFHLLEVEHVKQDGEITPDGIRNDNHGGLVPAEAALHASKNIPKADSLFALQHAFTHIDLDGRKMTLTTTDLQQEKSVEAVMIDGRYRSYEQIFPKEAPVGRISVNPKYLKEMAEYFAKHGEGARVLIEFYGEERPLVFRGETKDIGQRVRGILMPLHIQEEETDRKLQEAAAEFRETVAKMGGGSISVNGEEVVSIPPTRP
jgi:hypothetical protein